MPPVRTETMPAAARQEATAVGRLGHNAAAHAIWSSMRSLMDGSRHAHRFNGIVEETPLAWVPPEDLPPDVQGSNYNVVVKCDNEQPGGAYKLQGVTHYLLNAIRRAPPDNPIREAVVASTGNHAIETAIAATCLGLERAHAFVPNDISAVKLFNIHQRNAEVHFRSSLEDCLTSAQAFSANNPGMVFIHPYDQLEVVAGQGNSTLSTARQLKKAGISLSSVKAEIAPGGGGGNPAGKAVAARMRYPDARFVVAQSVSAAGIVALRAGRPFDMATFGTVVDGAAVPHPGRLPAKILTDTNLVHEAHAVSHAQVGEAMAVLARSVGVFEPAGALALAQALRMMRDEPRGRGILVVHGSGGNVTLQKAQEMATYAYKDGRLTGREAALYMQTIYSQRQLSGIEEAILTGGKQQPGLQVIRHSWVGPNSGERLAGQPRTVGSPQPIRR
jgi:threonine dehydratase